MSLLKNLHKTAIVIFIPLLIYLGLIQSGIMEAEKSYFNLKILPFLTYSIGAFIIIYTVIDSYRKQEDHK